MSRIVAKCIPRLLTDEQKYNIKVISLELLKRVETGLDLFFNIILTGNEIWIYDMM